MEVKKDPSNPYILGLPLNSKGTRSMMPWEATETELLLTLLKESPHVPSDTAPHEPHSPATQQVYESIASKLLRTPISIEYKVYSLTHPNAVLPPRPPQDRSQKTKKPWGEFPTNLKNTTLDTNLSEKLEQLKLQQ